MEEFEEIKDFEEYKINRNGEVMGKFGRILKNRHNKKGYLQVALMKDGKEYSKRVHRLVGLQFIDNPNNLPIVDHIDCNRQNNCLENLRWVSIIENNNNKIVRGGIYWIENNWRAQITIYGKKYSKRSKDKSVVEEWLEKIKIDLKNNVFEDIPKIRGCIFWDRNWRAQITICGKKYSKRSKDKSVVEEWLEKIKIENGLN